MKKLMIAILGTFALTGSMHTFCFAGSNETPAIVVSATKYDIKIKNDSDDEVSVINAGSGGSYRLTKNATTTIKMEEGDKLYIYESGKKGRLLLTASSDMDGKVQLFSKL